MKSSQFPVNSLIDLSNFKDLIVFKKSFELAMEIFELTKTFPMEDNLFSLLFSRQSRAGLKEKYPRINRHG